MKFCEDCAWMHGFGDGVTHRDCTHPLLMRPGDAVTRAYASPLCISARKEGSACGPGAKLWRLRWWSLPAVLRSLDDKAGRE